MGWEGWYTLTVVTLVMGHLIFSRISPDVVLMGGLALLLVPGVLTPEQALSGLSNEGMVTVGVLYFVAAGLTETGAVSWIVRSLMGGARSVAHAQAKLMPPIMVMSAFLNNTAVVAIMTDAVLGWARRNKISVSKLLIPLSYAGIFGGTCTLIGTTTNLVVNGLIKQESGLEGIGMFDIAWVGLPCAVAGFLLVLILTPRLLPDRKPAVSEFDDPREYMLEMIVEPDSSIAGKTIDAAGLRNLPGMYLSEIDRGDHRITVLSPDVKLKAGDRLLFVGIVDSVSDVLGIKGLKPAANRMISANLPPSEQILVEAVVSSRCRLVGRTVRQGRFRSVYDAVIIAIARGGDRIREPIGNVTLRPGDTLLLAADPSFVDRERNSRDFYLVSAREEQGTLRHERAPVALAILAGMVLIVATGVLPMLKAAMLAAGLMVITRCVSGQFAMRQIDWQVLIVIGASFGIGHAMQTTGAADAVAGTFISWAGPDPWMNLAVIYLITSIFTAVITNNAASVLMFPIALSTAASLQVDVMPYAITIMMAASASFATPIGYQTNLMVFGPGGYHFSDYLRFGLPINLAIGALTILIIPHVWLF